VGGVGGAVTKIAARREFVEHLVVADYDAARAEKAVAALGDPRFVATQVDATDEAAVRGAADRAPVPCTRRACTPRRRSGSAT
jgi:saccharopine dehydrogenase-like NADP-dependent oxidoreductase